MKLIRKEDGAGGKYMMDFLKKHVISRFDSKAGEIALSDFEDSSDFDKYAFTTDSYVVNPPVFPGGSIGGLAVCGTSNDLAVLGAKPAVMSMSLIIQDGFSLKTLDWILDDMAKWLKKIDAKIITGDTKVVEVGIGIAVNTTGIGLRNEHLEKNLSVVREYRDYPHSWVRDSGLADGDAIIITGNIAEHAAAIMAGRGGFGFELDVRSDVYPVWLFLRYALETGGITAMKDPTRGGVAAVLNEMAEKSGIGILVEEEKIPMKDDVKSFCNVLGLDPLIMANEGKVVMGVVADQAEDVLKALKRAGQKNAAIVGRATSEYEEVVIETSIGTRKILPPPTADPIPRVC
ncbi:hydrogenase expression/formation protein HypE [Archaeoglobales archaeon]|nr:MAG: hydrogenase expression/formation protein HypE [Archaeoglobales archaeon]